MLLINRDTKRGGERFAIPTQGEVEGKLVVLETVAVTCLRAIMETADPFALARLKGEILEAIEQHCEPYHLSAEDQLAAVDYAKEFFAAARKEAARRPIRGRC